MAGRGTFQDYGAGQTMGFLEMEGAATVSAFFRVFHFPSSD